MRRWLPPLSAAIVVAVVVAALPLGAIPRAIAIACVIASFGAAAFLRRPDVRSHASVVAGIAAVTAAGQTQGGALYGVLAGAFLLVSVVSLRVSQQTAPAKLVKGPNVLVGTRKGRTAVIFGVTGAIVTASVLTLPPLAAKIERTVTGMFGLDPAQQTAFSTRMMLGATHDLLQSDAIVARIDGRHPEYLRGAVYDEYDGAAWKTTMVGRVRRRADVARADGATQIELDKSAPTGSDDLRWFLPPDACGFDHEIEIDAFGVARRESGDRRLRYSTSGCMPAPTHAPTAADLEVTGRMAVKVREIAATWTMGATTDREKLERLEHELAKYQYSLEVPRAAEVDPIVDFLTIHKAGHCEYFASAMVLMARTQGIPARVIGGFRVTEVNPITNQAIVRDRNAHAWVEAWYDGAWHAWDPTPASSSPGLARSFLDHVGDLWSLAWERLTSIGPLGYAVILLGVIALLLLIRSIGNFLARPRRRRTRRAMERPLPCFEALTAALAAVGFERDESEPIESFAVRIPNDEIAAALTAYAAFRYGGIGDEAAVVRAAENARKATSSVSRRRPSS